MTPLKLTTTKFIKTSLIYPDYIQLGKRRIKLQSDFTYNGITVPKGFICDGASIPAIVWSITGLHPLHHRIIAGAIIHDYLYRFGGLISDKQYTRKEADKMLVELMKIYGANFYQRQAVYWAVRSFGWRFWR